MRSALQKAVAVGALCLGLPSSSLVAQEPPAGDEPVEMSISALNRVFDSLDAGFVPIEQGPVRILISSPAHRLEVFQNRLSLGPSEKWEDGIEATFEVDLAGWADLVAQLETAMGVTPYNDKVVVKRQWVKSDAAVKLTTTEGGYLLELLEALTPTVGFQIESEMVDQIVGTCRAFAGLLPGLSCDGMSASLARIEVPLPAAGTRYTINGAYLTDAERAIFDRFAVDTHPASDR